MKALSKIVKVNLILSIESSCVRSLIAIMDGGIPTVLHSAENPIKPQKENNPASLISATLKVVEQSVARSADRLYAMYADEEAPRKHFDDIHIALSSPWVIAKNKTVTMQLGHKITVNRDVILENIKKEVDAYVKENDDITVIEQKIFKVLLNGYSIDDWQGKYANRVDVSFAISVAGIGMVQRITEACEQISHRHKYMHSASLLLLGIVGKIYDHCDDCLMFNIHGELTDIVATNDGICTLLASCPIGYETIGHIVGMKISSDDQSADSLISMCIGGHLSSGENVKEISAVESTMNDWANEIGDILKEFGVNNTGFTNYKFFATKHAEFFRKSITLINPKGNVSEIDSGEVFKHIRIGKGAVQTGAKEAFITLAINSLE